MTVREILETLCDTVKDFASNAWDYLMNTSFSNIIRVGVMAGIGISAVVIAVKYIKSRKKIYSDTSNKTKVDEALEMNFYECDIDPSLKKIRKELTRDQEYRRPGKKEKKVDYFRYAKSKKKRWLSMEDMRMEAEADLLAKQNYVNFERFKREYPKRHQRDWSPRRNDTSVLYRTWKGTKGYWE